MEIWKDIVRYEGLYMVSDKGNVKALDRMVDNRWGGKVFKKSKNIAIRKTKKGYERCCLICDKKINTAPIHRLVAEAFIPNPYNKPCINHIDCNPSNNNVKNLEWVTYSENILHAEKMGRRMHVRELSSKRMKELHFNKDKRLKNYA